LLALKDEKEDLSFLVHPNLRSVVQRDDWTYVDSLLQDFRVHAKQHPVALFEQILSLRVGPLLTQNTGWGFPNLALFQGFVELN
jgi:hypothetical protein